MLLLSYFDRIMGPLVFLTNPQNLANELEEGYVEQINSLLDTENNGFFTHNFSPELKTANCLFKIDSIWARGRSELAMISAIVSEEEPDYTTYEEVLSKFVEKIKNIPEIFKAFYINKGPTEEEEEIQSKFSLLKEELNNLYKILAIKKIETEGQLVEFTKLKKDKVIELSDGAVNKLSKIMFGIFFV
ncbi:MAG: hypothetical protein ACFFAO_07745 [Candidatus Hermodarchaeota archaeon]